MRRGRFFLTGTNHPQKREENKQKTNAGLNLHNGHKGKEKILELLNQEGCVGIRFYYAINDKGEKILVLVGADSNENDMENGLLLENGNICPPFCPKKNVLNS